MTPESCGKFLSNSLTNPLWCVWSFLTWVAQVHCLFCCFNCFAWWSCIFLQETCTSTWWYHHLCGLHHKHPSCPLQHWSMSSIKTQQIHWQFCLEVSSIAPAWVAGIERGLSPQGKLILCLLHLWLEEGWSLNSPLKKYVFKSLIIIFPVCFGNISGTEVSLNIDCHSERGRGQCFWCSGSSWSCGMRLSHLYHQIWWALICKWCWNVLDGCWHWRCLWMVYHLDRLFWRVGAVQAVLFFRCSLSEVRTDCLDHLAK